MRTTARLLATATASLVSWGLLAAPAATAHPAGPHPERRATFAPTLDASKSAPVAGAAVVLSGRVKPVRKGVLVVLQKRRADDRTWVVEARLRTTRSGAFRYTDRPHEPGVRRYRVVVPAAGKVKKGISKPVAVTVYAWKVVGKSLYPRETSATWNASGASINGHVFEHAYVGARSSTQGFADFNLNRKCTLLRARLGNSDASDVAAVARVSIIADGVSKYVHSFGLTQSQQVSVNIKGAFRMAFDWTNGAPGATGASAIMAEPEVLCSF